MNFPTLPTTLTEYANDNFLSVETTLRHATDKFKIGPIARPNKPTLRPNHTSEEIEVYARLFCEYETAKHSYDTLETLRRKHNDDVEHLIKIYLCDASGLNDIPQQYQDAVWSKAWEDGHSDGYYSVYTQLCELVELVDIFKN